MIDLFFSKTKQFHSDRKKRDMEDDRDPKNDKVVKKKKAPAKEKAAKKKQRKEVEDCQDEDVVLYLAIDDWKAFQNMFVNLTEYGNECQLFFEETGLEIMLMDTSNVSIVHCKINAGYFSKYSTTRSMTLGVNLSVFNKILDTFDSDDTLIMSSKDTDKLTIICENEAISKRGEIIMNLMTISEDIMQVTETKPTAVIQMGSDQYRRLVEGFNKIGDSVELTVEGVSARFESQGDMCKSKVDFHSNAEKGMIITCTKKIEVEVSLRWLKIFCAFSKSGKKVKLTVDDEGPAMFDMHISDHFLVRLFLAPRNKE